MEVMTRGQIFILVLVASGLIGALNDSIQCCESLRNSSPSLAMSELLFRRLFRPLSAILASSSRVTGIVAQRFIP